MTPKEKAKELYELMYYAMPCDPLQEGNEDKAATKCALICVDKIMETLKKLDSDIDKNYYWHPYDFWQQVKTEIQKL